jgi:polyhydroxyalkanoate synthase
MPLLPEHSALQHEHAPQRAPRPLPLFLELVRQAAGEDAELARAALAGLRAYEAAERPPRDPPKPVVARIAGTCLRDHGGDGPPAILIPSLINPPRILDLDPQVSLTGAIASMGRRALLLDWGNAADRAGLDVGGHIAELLVPLLSEVGEPAALIGYCLGGTMAVAAANLVETERVVTLAAPWNFSGYEHRSRDALASIWRQSRDAAHGLGALPMEVLQAAFWSLDPTRTVRKFAEFGRLDPASAEALRFVSLEDWANEGEPLPYPAARELMEDLFAGDFSGSGAWRVGTATMTDRIDAPLLNILAMHDRISPRQAAPEGDHALVEAGHVGMIVGSARAHLHQQLRQFLEKR